MIRASEQSPQLPPTAVATRAGDGQTSSGRPSLPIPPRLLGSCTGPNLSGGPKLGLPDGAFKRQQPPYVTVATPHRAAGRRKATQLREPHPRDSAVELPMGRTISGTVPRWAYRSMSESSWGSCFLSSQSPGNLQMGSVRSGLDFSRQDSCKYAPDVFKQAQHNTLDEKYDVVDHIYSDGNQGAVCTVRRKDNGRMYACKEVYKVCDETKAIRKEIEMLKKLDHPNIVRLFEILEDDVSVFLILELCHGGDLYETIEKSDGGRLTEPKARTVLRQVLDALAFCHAKKIVHRDVKPENFLLVTSDPDCLTLKLTDFGISTAIRPENFAKTLSSQEWSSACFDSFHESAGTMHYMAPESFSPNPPQQGKCDVWGAGVLLYFALSGEFPYGTSSSTPDEICDKICSGAAVEFRADCWKTVPEDVKDLISRMMKHNVQERLTAQQALEHKWFRVDDAEGLQEVSSNDCRDGKEVDISPRKAPCILLQALRSFKKKSQLRRWAITAMANNLTEHCETQRLAKTIYKMFCDTSNILTCERLVQILTAAQSEDNVYLSECASVTSKGSVRSWKLTGQEMTKRFNEMFPYTTSTFRRLASLPETPTFDASPSTESACSFNSSEGAAEDLADLVGALDAKKSGTVNYTLLVAALLPERVYCDDMLIKEAFHFFDTTSQGRIRPNDLRVAMDIPSGYPGLFSKLVKQFDRDGDGSLDLADFRAMVRGEVGAQSQTPAGKTPASKTPMPTDKWPFVGMASRSDAAAEQNCAIIKL